MAVWWLAIDESGGTATYEELKKRRVVAQGWPALGDMVQNGRLDSLKSSSNEQRQQLLGRWMTECHREPGPDQVRNLASFFCDLQPGDLVVGRPGQRIAGICKLPSDTHYNYDPAFSGNGRYAHGFGPVDWYDWDEVSPTWDGPNPPAQLHAVVKLATSEERVSSTYAEFIRQRSS